MQSAQQPLWAEKLRTVVRWVLFTLVLLTPLPFGSVQPGSVLAIELGSAVLGAGGLVLLYLDRGRTPSRMASALFLAAGVMVLLALLQLTPVPASLVRTIASPTAEARSELATVLPETAADVNVFSLSPPVTIDAVLRLVAYVCIGLAAAVAIRTPRQLSRLAVLIALSGALQALYGSAEYLSGNQHIFGYAKKYFLDEATGTFVNRNHFAGYLAMTLPFALGLSLANRKRAEPATRGWRERLLGLDDPRTRVFLMGALATMMIWVGVLLSYSRSGIVCALAATAVVASGWLRRHGILTSVLILGIPLILLLFIEIRAPGARFATLAEDVFAPGGRLGIWRATLDLSSNYLALGSGFGTFAEVLPLFDRSGSAFAYAHAHNDWLQVLAEGGLVALLVPLSVSVVGLRIALRRRVFGRESMVWQRCAVASVAGMAIYSLTDFCLRIPAISVLLAIILGLCGSAVLARESGETALRFRR